MRFTVKVAGLLGLLLLVSPAHATKMSGKVMIKNSFVEALEKKDHERAKGSKAYYWQLPNGLLPVRPPRLSLSGDIAVVLFKENGDDSSPDSKKKIIVETGQLERNVIVTRPGSTLEFMNESPYVHELYSPELPNFKPEAQSKGAFRPIEFKNEGIFEVRCKRMPGFLGYVVVTGGEDVAVKSDGTFADEIEPGKYTLKVFFDGAWIHKQSFTAEERKMDPLSVTLTAPSSSAEADEQQSNDEKDGK